MRTSTTRADLLQAAERIVETEGSKKLTLDAVARAAGLSKGGVLYHFPTKAALVEAMVRYHLDQMDEAMEQFIAEEPPGPGRVVRAWFHMHMQPCPVEAGVHLDMWSYISKEPTLLHLIGEHRARWLARIEQDGIDPPLATLLAFAAEGVWCAETFGPGPPTEEVKASVLAIVRRLTNVGAAT